MAAEIKYMGEVIATAEKGQTTVLKCEDRKMGGDIEVTPLENDIDADELNEVVSAAVADALQEAKDSGDFKGEKGETGAAGADGKDGADGKSAYSYAQDGGYEGTEAEFAEKLAAEPPKAFYITLNSKDMTVDKTDAEIEAAYQAGCSIFCLFPSGSGTYVACPLSSRASSTMWLFSMVGLVPLAKNAEAGYILLSNGTWQFEKKTLANADDIPAPPVIKTTAEITPTEVKALMDEGKPFAITHTDSTYGSMLFNNFVYSHAANNSILSSTIFELAGMKFCAQLMGRLPTDAWEFKAFQLAGKDDIPTALPNPNALTINGKVYDGSEAVNITVSGGGASDNTLLGQTPFTLTEKSAVKLIGAGEHSYTVKGKTVADLSVCTVANNGAEVTQTDDYIEFKATSEGEWHQSYVALTVKGLTVGTSYVLAIQGLGLDSTNLINNGYCQIRNSSGSSLGTSTNTSYAQLEAVNFTASTSDIVIRYYPSSQYYWNLGHRTARIKDIYINEAADGTDRTDIVNKSGTFTDSYTLGTLSAGVTISANPACEVYAVGGGDSESGESLPLAGKKIVCFGDSLFGMYTGDTSAPAYVAKRTGATVYNAGFSGCRMSVHPYVGYNEFCMYALADAIASGDWSAQDSAASSGSSNFPDQLAVLKGIDFSDVDAIVIHYGTNDFTAGSSGVAIDNVENPTDVNTLCGAMRHSIETLLGAYPKLRIFISLPAFRFWTADDGTVTYSDTKTNGSGKKLTDYVEAIANTAKEYNLPIIDSYYGLGINKTNCATFLGDGVHHNVDGRKRFGEYIGAKLIADGDSLHSADNGGGTSIDVTAEVGQTIVVKEVDASGKPTKWEAAEYQPRTHYMEWAELLPETTLTIDEESGVFLTPVDFTFKVGETYKVSYNGAEYNVTAFEYIEEGISLAMIGNGAALELADTGEPFIAWVQEGALVILSYEEVTEITFKIEGQKVFKLDKKYYDYGVFYFDVTKADDKTCTTTLTPRQLFEAYSSGMNIIARIIETQNGHDFQTLLPLVQANTGVGFDVIFSAIFRGYGSATTVEFLSLGIAGGVEGEPLFDTPYECTYGSKSG